MAQPVKSFCSVCLDIDAQGCFDLDIDLTAEWDPPSSTQAALGGPSPPVNNGSKSPQKSSYAREMQTKSIYHQEHTPELLHTSKYGPEAGSPMDGDVLPRGWTERTDLHQKRQSLSAANSNGRAGHQIPLGSSGEALLHQPTGDLSFSYTASHAGGAGGASPLDVLLALRPCNGGSRTRQTMHLCPIPRIGSPAAFQADHAASPQSTSSSWLGMRPGLLATKTCNSQNASSPATTIGGHAFDLKGQLGSMQESHLVDSHSRAAVSAPNAISTSGTHSLGGQLTSQGLPLYSQVPSSKRQPSLHGMQLQASGEGPSNLQQNAAGGLDALLQPRRPSQSKAPINGPPLSLMDSMQAIFGSWPDQQLLNACPGSQDNTHATSQGPAQVHTPYPAADIWPVGSPDASKRLAMTSTAKDQDWGENGGPGVSSSQKGVAALPRVQQPEMAMQHQARDGGCTPSSASVLAQNAGHTSGLVSLPAPAPTLSKLPVAEGACSVDMQKHEWLLAGLHDAAMPRDPFSGATSAEKLDENVVAGTLPHGNSSPRGYLTAYWPVTMQPHLVPLAMGIPVPRKPTQPGQARSDGHCSPAIVSADKNACNKAETLSLERHDLLQQHGFLHTGACGVSSTPEASHLEASKCADARSVVPARAHLSPTRTRSTNMSHEGCADHDTLENASLGGYMATPEDVMRVPPTRIFNQSTGHTQPICHAGHNETADLICNEFLEEYSPKEQPLLPDHPVAKAQIRPAHLPSHSAVEACNEAGGAPPVPVQPFESG
ncbi:hypothetical protein WJX84_002720 [Apatococcus fuscideae]